MSPEIDEQETDSLSLLYQECREDWRHYDNLIWQVTNIAIAVNGFLIIQGFNKDFNTKIRIIIPLIAAFFTFIFLIALVKHRLHQDIRSWNIREIEKKIISKNNRPTFFNLDDKKDYIKLGIKPSPFIFLFKKAGGFNWLCIMMTATIAIDLLIVVGTFFSWWI